MSVSPLPSLFDIDTVSSGGSPGASSRGSFLERMRTGEGRYRRYGGLPLRYAGGKSRAVGHIIEAFPDGLTRLVSPFFGGGSVEIACARELGVEVHGYDVFETLVAYWRVQLDSPSGLAEAIGRWAPDLETYHAVKQRLRRHWLGEDPIEDDLELAAHYWFNHNLSYGPGFLGWMSKIYRESERVGRLVDKVRHFRADGLRVHCEGFETVIPRHKGDFLYCDPPYYLDDTSSKMFRGIYPQRNFPVHHDGFDHVRLRDLLGEHVGGFVLSYNDCATIRNWYADFDIREVRWQYTLGQGETRIGKNRVANGTGHYVKQSHELLIVGRP